MRTLYRTKKNALLDRSTDQAVKKDYYSGKKKEHTVKNNLITAYQLVAYLGQTHEGKKHDKAIL